MKAVAALTLIFLFAVVAVTVYIYSIRERGELLGLAWFRSRGEIALVSGEQDIEQSIWIILGPGLVSG